jgi:hypothetical protein
MSDTKPPPNGSAQLLELLKSEWTPLLTRLLLETLGDSGYGKIIISVYNKSIVGIDSTRTYRRGDDRLET